MELKEGCFMKSFERTAGLFLLAATAYGNYTYGGFDGSTVAFSEFMLFQNPDTLSSVLCTISPGTEIVIIGKADEVFEENQLVTDWYEVSCEINSVLQTGFAAGINFACTSQRLSDECVFVFGVTGYNPETNECTGLGRVVSNGAVLAEAEIKPAKDILGQTASFNVESALMETTGFSNIESMVVISFDYEACGYENRDTPVLWTGENIICAPYTSAVYEAGLFHYTEKCIFPGEPEGADNKITIVASSEIWNEDTQSYDLVDETTKSYIWTGNSFELVPAEPAPEE
jgi:hypothetical protein